VTISVFDSTLRITSILAISSNQVMLTFNAAANQSCTLLYTPALGSAWTAVTNYSAVSANRVIQQAAPAPANRGFYRLRSP
jgi:hypothetical protein